MTCEPSERDPHQSRDREDQGLSPLAQAVAWSSRITTVGLEMALPGLLGYWLDKRLGTSPLLLILLVAVGVTSGMIHLLRMVASLDRPRRKVGNRDP
ncbi:MAG TPA: AtpZ/AtpI family protein [Planctomycetes bacterium]|nr:AtpZ/AtpI family protein [Planctomycetota bacterium]